jgi:thiol-disulfide isomerase/thioredoxin
LPNQQTIQEQAASLQKAPKQLWATSFLYHYAPALDFAGWVGAEPESLEGKFIVLEFWRTWCSACKRSTPLLNQIHAELGDNVVVIGVTGQPRELVEAGWDGPKMDYFVALDKTSPDSEDSEQGALEAAFGVIGWPHVVILEPEFRAVIWEGFPLQKDYELKMETVRKMVAIHKEIEAEKQK